MRRLIHSACPLIYLTGAGQVEFDDMRERWVGVDWGITVMGAG